MFTGIIYHIGSLEKIVKEKNKDLSVTVKILNDNIPRFTIGSSISCNGICLTVISNNFSNGYLYLTFSLSQETIDNTTVPTWKEGDFINIEFSLKIGDELSGHMVSGHVDGIGEVLSIIRSEDSHIISFSFNSKIRRFITKKGSITIDGVSLTINQIYDDSFEINLIKHSFKKTALKFLKVKSKVNLEIDLIARYCDNLINHSSYM